MLFWVNVQKLIFQSQCWCLQVIQCYCFISRFNKLLWSDCGMDTNDHPNGLILGGTDAGELCVLNAASILSGDKAKSTVHTFKEHSGAINTLDINTFQSNIVVSGGPDSEILIWDLKNPGTPLNPGPKSAPPDQISCLAWNKQVQHILASSSPTGRVVVWDLRKSEPIIKVGDQSAMVCIFFFPFCIHY